MSATDTAVDTTLPETGTWVIDPAHSSIDATARHLMISKVRGSFESFSGTIEVGDEITRSSIDVSIDAASINTGQEDRDGHLVSEDFLHADEHPQLTFESTQIEQVDTGSYRVTGDLTIRGETHPVDLDVDYLGEREDPWGNPRTFFEATTTLNREQWSMTWNQALEAGGVMVGKELDVELDIQAVAQDEQ